MTPLDLEAGAKVKFDISKRYTGLAMIFDRLFSHFKVIGHIIREILGLINMAITNTGRYYQKHNLLAGVMNSHIYTVE